MKKDLHYLSVVFLSLFVVVGYYWLFKGAFFLMSQRSTVENIGGFVIAVLLLASVFIIIKNIKIK